MKCHINDKAQRTVASFAFCLLSSSSHQGQEAMLRWVLLALLFGLCLSAGEPKKKKVKPQSLSRGWGNNITWEKNYEEGLAKMVKSKKPLMVIHHRVDCPHSQALKKAFVADKSIQKMAQQDFIMLNLVEETSDKNLAPDGHYVPRILFVDPSKTVRVSIAGKHSPNRYTYKPDDMAILAQNMKKAKVLLHEEL
ncbi:anterior gradient 1 [Betta splendens]|uniref:Anterior gradient 1 n=1 Tax=Betta splendens TaxID=158456 RepID=A0A6P7LE52_BETSP|nr:anterior gradient 1 [Betta splendens]XP_028992465.1 anterior gradient 1 [Betta splendens]